MKNRVLLGLIFILTACAATPPKQVKINSKFDEVQAKELLKEGKNTVKGSALLRQKNGGVVTCAGQGVTLIPATDYAKERMIAIYSYIDKGFNSNNNLLMTPDEPKYHSLVKETLCDAQGFFKFKKVSDGEFFVITSVSWEVPRSRYSQPQQSTLNGGALMKMVELRGGELKEIVLTNN